MGVEIFRICPDRPWGPPSLLYNGYRVFPGVKRGQGVTLTCHSYYCRGQERVELYLYSLYGTYGLYRASVPVQRYTLPLPIPLLPLWTVRPVQSLSACATVHFTFYHCCDLLGYYAACSGKFLPTVRDNLLVPSSRANMEPTCPETSVSNYHYMLRHRAEEIRSHVPSYFFFLIL